MISKDLHAVHLILQMLNTLSQQHWKLLIIYILIISQYLRLFAWIIFLFEKSMKIIINYATENLDYF